MKHTNSIIRVLFLALFLFLVLKGKMMLWLALFAVSLAAALMFGRVYCGYACPMNTMMIPTDWLAKKLNLQTDTYPKWLRSGNFAWIALVGSIAFMLIAKRLWKMNLPILLVWLIASVVITLRYKPAVFHNLICPFGALQKVFGKSALFSKKVNIQDCIGCKLCEKVCPSDAIAVRAEDKKAEISTTLCLECTNCQQVCPKSAIRYSKQK